MFTHKDISARSLFIVHGLEHQKLRVSQGRLMLENTETHKAITTFPFPKILSLFIIGHTTVTTSLIEHCNKHGISLVVMKPNFRPVFYFGNMAEANFLLRKKQFDQNHQVLDIAKVIIGNKLNNQKALLIKTRETNDEIKNSINIISHCYSQIDKAIDYRYLMGLEGKAATHFFRAYYQFAEWNQRLPRVKPDKVNASLDMGYTMLFNFIECMTRLFGFDPYMGIYHQLWFRRKSLVCDLMEPFRCIIEHQLRKSLKAGTFKTEHFTKKNLSVYLKPEHSKIYSTVFFEAIIQHKNEIYKYVQAYYRCFMGKKSVDKYPVFNYE